MSSQRIQNLITVYEEIVKRSNVVLEKNSDDNLKGYIELTDEAFDKIVNEAFSAAAVILQKTESTVRESITRDICISTDKLKKAFKNSLTHANTDLEVIASLASTDKDDRNNVIAKIRSI